MADLSALLDKEASAEIEIVLSEAQTRASEIVAKAKSEADALLASRLRAAESQREATLVRARSSAQLEAASLRLNAQHDGVQAAFAAAKQEISELIGNPAKYAPLFTRLLTIAVEAAGASAVKSVVVNPSDEELAKVALGETGVKATVETSEDVKGGVRVQTDTRSVIESTLFGRLESLQGELAPAVSAALFGDKIS